MIQKIKNIMLALILPFTMSASFALVPVAAHALDTSCGITDSISEGAGAATGNGAQCGSLQGQGTASFGDLAKKIVNLLSIIVGVVAVIMIIVGGFRYITSGGESSNVSGAKNTLIYAIVGLVIVALAQFIVHFVLANVTGSTV